MPSACSSVPPPGQRRRAVEDADVVEPEEPALEQVAAVRVLAVDPPGEVGQQPVEDADEELAVALPALLDLALVDPQRRPGGDRRVDVGEVPLVGRDLPVRVLVAGAQQQRDLLLREVDVDEPERRAVEGQVPRGEPRVLPLVRHRDHVAGEEVEPRDVAQPAAGGVLAPRVDALLAQPAVDVVLVVLLAPQQPGERLAHDVRRVRVEVAGDDAGVEGVRLGDPLREHRVEVDRAAARVQPHPDLRRAAGRDLEHVVRGDLGPGPRRVDGVGARDHVVVDPVLRVRRAVRAGDPARVRLVVAEQQLAASPRSATRRARRARPARRRRRRRSTAAPTRRATCCGTRASAAGAASPPPARGCAR